MTYTILSRIQASFRPEYETSETSGGQGYCIAYSVFFFLYLKTESR